MTDFGCARSKFVENKYVTNNHGIRARFLKPTYATGNTGTLMFKKKGTYTVDGLINGGGGGVKSVWAYIRNNIFIGKWMGLYPGSLKPEEGFKVGFYAM